MTGATNDEEKTATLQDLAADETKVEPLLTKLTALCDEEQWDETECRHLAQDAYFVRRCLIASLNDETKALKTATAALRWRSKVKPSQLTMQDFPTAASQNMFSVACHAKNGWPVSFGYAVRWNPWRYSTAEYGRMIAFLLESCEKGLNPNDPMARMYFVFDMKGMSKLNSDLRKIAELTKFAAIYYPERVVTVVLNADFITFFLWKFVSPLLDRRTRERVTILRSNGLDLLDEIVGLENVGPIIGGSRSEEWPIMSMETRQNFTWGVDATGRAYGDDTLNKRQSGVEEEDGPVELAVEEVADA